MDPNRLPPIDPDRLHGNSDPLPNPWRSHSGYSSNTPVSDLEIPENQQNPEKRPCVEPPVEMAGPDPQPWCKPRQAAEPVVSGPGGRFFRPIQEYQSEILFYQSPVAPDLLLNCNVGPSVVDKIEFIKGTSVGRRNLKDPNLYAVVRRQVIAPIEKSIKKHEALPRKAVKWLNEYYILAQLVGTDEMKKQAQYFRTTEEYINSSGDARTEYNDCLERVEKKRPQVTTIAKFPEPSLPAELLSIDARLEQLGGLGSDGGYIRAKGGLCDKPRNQESLRIALDGRWKVLDDGSRITIHMAIDILDARTSQGSINKRMDPNRLPPIDPNRLHGNSNPFPNPWYSHSGHSSNTPVSEIPENQQNPEKRPCLEPPASALGPPLNLPSTPNPTNARTAEEDQQPAQGIPSKPVVGPGGHMFRRVEGYQDPGIEAKIRKIQETESIYSNARDKEAETLRKYLDYAISLVQKTHAEPPDIGYTHKDWRERLNEYYVYALAGTENVKNQLEYYKRTKKEAIQRPTSSEAQIVRNIESKNLIVGPVRTTMIDFGLADQDGLRGVGMNIPRFRMVTGSLGVMRRDDSQCWTVNVTIRMIMVVQTSGAFRNQGGASIHSHRQRDAEPRFSSVFLSSFLLVSSFSIRHLAAEPLVALMAPAHSRMQDHEKDYERSQKKLEIARMEASRRTGYDSKSTRTLLRSEFTRITGGLSAYPWQIDTAEA
ncbi:hypothetical protein F5880DRAFT_1687560, partial [Lentinula raphanica]